MVAIEAKAKSLKTFKNPLNTVINRVEKCLTEKYTPGMIHRLSQELFVWKGNENIKKLQEPLADGAHLWIVLSHQSQADVGPAVEIAHEIQREFPEYINNVNYIVAKTMGTGKQGDFLRKIYLWGVREQFRRNGIGEIEVVSKNDYERRGENPDIGAVLRLKRAIRQNGSAIMIHVEGTMDPGRINPETGEIQGMVDMDYRFKKLMINEFKNGLDIVFLPVAIDGGYRIYDPNTRNFTKEGIREVAISELSLLYGFPHLAPLGEVNIGSPFRGSEIEESPDPAGEIMARVANLMPYYARGKYK